MAATRDTKTPSAAKLALLATRLHDNVQDMQILAAEPVALVGMACRLPGNVSNPTELWRFLLAGGDGITEVPPERWSHAAYYDPDPAAVGKINTRCGGFLRGVDEFDAPAFGIAPREARYMDPQQRLLLEIAAEAFDDAGLPLESLRGSSTGVFFGLAGSDYGRLMMERPATINAHTLSGTLPSIAAGRLSYLYDLRGPCMVIETACSSSLVAVHSAVQSLRSREANLAVAGGVSLNLAPEQTIALARWGMLAPDGRCKTFDASANGFVRSEGCALVVLKRLADALRDRDRIYAVIRGTAINQDGRSNVLTAPNGEAQRSVIRAALRQAQVAPSDVTYVETHGTGTKVGDPIEVEALVDIVGQPRADGGVCYLGALKANLGHLEPAAGVAGLIKAALCIEHGAIPRQIHFGQLNPLVSLEATALRIPTEAVPWSRGAQPRVAGVSSFGFSGTNAHVVIEEPPQLAAPRRRVRAEILALSARTPRALDAQCAEYARFLGAADAPALADVCYTAGARRTHYAHRAAFVATSTADLRAELASSSQSPAAHSARPVFVFSGQGSGWTQMGASLLRDEPVFAAAIARCDAWLDGRVSWRVADLLRSGDGAWLLDTERYQVALFALQVGLVELWAHWGIEPVAVVGHSVGEIAAAHTAGALTFEQALDIVVRRARLMQTVTQPGAMAVAELPPTLADRLVSETPGALVVAAYNGSRSVTVAGDASAVDAFLALPELAGKFARRLAVDRAFHSPAMAPAALALAGELAALEPLPLRLDMCSTVTGARLDGTALGGAYWARNVREPVRFAEAVEALLRDGHDCFIEIGPHPGLLSMIEAPDRALATLPSLRREADGRSVMLQSLARLYEAGADVRWAHVTDAEMARCVSLPAYPWQRERLWLDDAAAPVAVAVAASPAWPGARVDTAFPAATVFETVFAENEPAWLAEHRLAGVCVVPAAALIDLAVVASLEVTGAERIELADGAIRRPLLIPNTGRQSVQVGIVAESAGQWRVKISARAQATAEPWVEHFECVLRVAATDTGFDTSKPAALGQALDIGDLYARMAATGVELGAPFRRVVRLFRRDRAALAELAPDAAVSPVHALDPRSLDGCFHGAAAFFEGSGVAWLPVGFSRLTVTGRRAVLGSSATRLVERSASGDELNADLTLFDNAGRACAEVQGFRVRAVPTDVLRALVGAGSTPLLHELRWVSSDVAGGVSRREGWLVLADRVGVAAAFAAGLEAAGAACTIVDVGAPGGAGDVRAAGRLCIDATDATALAALLSGPAAKCLRVAVLTALDIGEAEGRSPFAAQARVSRVGLAALRACGSSNVQELWFVTRGAQRFVDVGGAAQAPLWGLAAVAAHEYPALRCRAIDLDPGDDAAAQAAALLVEARAPDDGETRIAWSDGRRLAQRLVPFARPTPVGESAWRIAVPPTLQLADLRRNAAEMPRPGAGEVVIETHAVGVNFRDVLNALGMLGAAAPQLGGECAGRVVAVGEGVDVGLVGRRVMAFAIGALASHVSVSRSCVVEIPAGLGDAEAASLPVVFLTALYGLEDLAELRRGETVLIHAAAGGVGLAACQVAAQRGATVIATASSPAKQAFLRSLGIEHVLSSRDPSFADAALALTGGKGVDVVLNSLSDDLVTAGFRALRSGGRFVELGKRGTWSRDEARERRPDARYAPFDLSTVAFEHPERIAQLFERFVRGWASGDYRPIPLRSYSLEELPQAFDYMARARHIGKIVVTVPVEGASIGAGTYLVTGANAGLAPLAIETLVEGGAKRLALWSRNEAGSALTAVTEQCRARGVAVDFATCDVADAAAVQQAAAALPHELDGVLHLAGVVDDAPLATLSWERFAAVLQPKIAGSWHLHCQLLDTGLRHWVGYSSVAALFGWPGQGAYAAGNAYLDALARYRARCGWPALALNWGPWGGTGMARRAAESHETDFAARGLGSLTPHDGAQALLQALSAGGAEYVAVRYDAQRLPRGSLTRLIEARGEDSRSGADARAQLAAVPAAERAASLRAVLEREAARVLGMKAGYRFDTRRPLNEVGLDSLLAVQLANALGTAFKLPASTTLLFDYPTLDALCAHLFAEVFPAPAAGPVERAATSGDATVGALSDAEAEAELLAELDELNRMNDRP